MIRLFQSVDLAAGLPADRGQPCQLRGDRVAWHHVVNLSPYEFELQDDAGNPRGIIHAWSEAAIAMRVRTESVNFHAFATTVTPERLAQGDWAVYWERSEVKPVLPGAAAGGGSGGSGGGGGSTLATGQVNVGAAATVLVPANPNRSSITFSNDDAVNPMWYGPPGVTVATGKKVGPGSSVTLGTKAAIDVIRGANPVVSSWAEESA